MNSISTNSLADISAERVRIIFLHHSTGRNLIRQGGVRELLRALNERDGTLHELWDHDYNEIGLSGPTGDKTGVSFNIPDDNTDPDGLDALFSQPVHDPPDNALSHLLTFDVIAFKSCFPVSAIRSASQLEEYKQHYLSIRKTLARYPQKLFVVLTPPPLVPRPAVLLNSPSSEKWTTAEDARRAREFSRWLTSEDFLAGLPNVVTFDLFDLLAASPGSVWQANTLRAEYRGGRLRLDSHPNDAANKAVAPVFVDFLHESTKNFQQSKVAASAAQGVLSAV